MYYVYLLRSTSSRSTYIGFSTDLRKRLASHNAGGSKHTAKYIPWKLVTYLAFSEPAARAFEAYLKTGSEQAFAKALMELS
jgi:putative endonuclease